MLDPGINYPAPWHVANWCGERITGNEEQQVYLIIQPTRSDNQSRKNQEAGRGMLWTNGNRVNVIGEKEFPNRPTILKGLVREHEKRVDGDYRFFSPESGGSTEAHQTQAGCIGAAGARAQNGS